MSTFIEGIQVVPVKFTLEDSNRAHDEWGANCGPGALAAVAGMTLNELRPFMGEFEQKGYTNPTLMFECLNRIGLKWSKRKVPFVNTAEHFPKFGLCRVQWEGPWTAPGVPMRVRYRHTHWIAAIRHDSEHQLNIFDINCMTVGGWVPSYVWTTSVVPWLLKNCEPKADGGWHLTHSIEVEK